MAAITDDIELRRLQARDVEATAALEQQLRISQEANRRKSRDEKDEDSDEQDILDEHEQLMKEGTEKRRVEGEEEDDDPAEMVRKVVPETDDPSLPTLTVRVLVIGCVAPLKLQCVDS